MRTGLTFARDFAIAAHGEQKYGDRPYSAHLDDVAMEVALFARDPSGFQDLSSTVKMAAFLHDVLEDTPVTAALLAAAFGDYTSDLVKIVQFCTDEPGPNRRTRKLLTHARTRETIASMLAAGPAGRWVHYAVQVKLADRIANLRSCAREGNASLLAMYRGEDGAFRGMLVGTLGADRLWEEYDSLIGNSHAENG